MARQILVLQVLVVLVLVVAALSLAAYDARRDARVAATDRAVAVAQAVADSPTVVGALDDADPSATLQPFAERVRRDTEVDFVVVMRLDRTRFTHPDPERIGEKFIGDLGGAPEGEVFTQEYTGTLGPSMRAVVPVLDDGRVAALVSVGITVSTIDRLLRQDLRADPARGARRARRRARGRVAGQPPAAPPDPRAGRAGDHPDVRVLQRGPARRPRGAAAARRRGPGPARQRRGAPPAAPARRRARPFGARPRPAARPGRRRAGPDRRVRRHLRRGRPRPGRQLRARVLAGPGGRLGRHPARPHRAAVGDRRARRRPGAHRLPALPEPRGRQPAAHGRLPHRDGPPRGGRRLRHRGAPGRPAAHRPRRRRGRRPRRRRPAARQDRGGRGARDRPDAHRRPARPRAPTSPRATWSRCSATWSTTRSTR